MTNPLLVNLQTLIDDAKCFEALYQLQWPEGVTCPGCESNQVVAGDSMKLNLYAVNVTSARHAFNASMTERYYLGRTSLALRTVTPFEWRFGVHQGVGTLGAYISYFYQTTTSFCNTTVERVQGINIVLYHTPLTCGLVRLTTVHLALYQ